MKGLIISSGGLQDYSLLERLISEHDFILCADGGLNHLMKLNRVPNLVIGDFDSISNESLQYIERQSIKIKKYPQMKNETDTELCVLYLLNNGFKEITLTGVTGSRLDHTLANIHLLKSLHEKGITTRIVDDNNIISYSRGISKVVKKDNYYVSIIPISTSGIIVSLSGFLFPLKNECIMYTSSLGISNEINAEYGIVEIHQGEALIIESKD